MKVFLSLFAISHILELLLGLIYLQFDIVDFQSYAALTESRNLIGGMFVMPFLETVFCQFIIIEAFVLTHKKIFKNAKEDYFLYAGALSSAFLFFLGHYMHNGPFSGFVAGIPGGTTLAIAYVYFRKTKVEAFAAAWLLHTLNNVYSLMLSVFFYKLIAGY